MRFLIFVTCVALAIAAPRLVKLGQDIAWEWCGDGRPIDVKELTVEPYPVILAGGASITAAITIEILENIPVGTMIKVKIVKDMFGLTLPCIEIDGHHIGSCEYEGDYLLDFAKDALCGDKYTPGGYFPEGQDCKLPLAPGTYGGKDPMIITLPDKIPDAILGLLHGKLHADLRALNADGSEIGCAKIHL